MTFKCNKCNKKFISRYLLDKHTNRKIPCTIEIKCNRCGKIFSSTIYLNRHLERKTPCENVNVASSSSYNNDYITLEREKMKHEIEKIKLQNEADIEKIKIKEDKKKEREIEVQKLKNDKVERQKEKHIEIENKKTERKGKTTNIINNNYTQNIKIEAETHINNQYNASIIYTSNKDKNQAMKNWYSKLENIKECENLYNDSKDLIELVANIFKNNFNNDYTPQTRCYMFDDNYKKFLSASKKSGKYEITEFSEISKILKELADTSYEIIEKSLSENISEIGSKYHNFSLYKNIYNSEKSLEAPAKIGLNPNNKIIKENKYGGAFSDSDDD